MLNTYLMIAVLGPLCTSRLSHSSSPLMNEKQVKRERGSESKLPLSCSQNVFCAVVSLKLHHRHKPCEPQSHLRVYDVWPAALPCQMAYYTEHPPTAHCKTVFLQMALCRIYTQFVRSVCRVKNRLYVASACST